MVPSPSEPLATEPNPKKAERRKLFIATGAVFLLFVAWILIVALYDSAPPDDHAMLPVFTGSPQNPLAEFQSWLEMHPLDTEDPLLIACLNKKTWKSEMAERIVAAHSAHFTEFERFISSDPAQWRWKGGDALANLNHSSEYLSQAKSVAHLLAVRARLQAEKHQYQEAKQTTLGIIKFGGGIYHAQGPLTAYLLAGTIQRAGYRALAIVMESGSFDVSDLQQMREAIARAAPDVGGYRFGLQADYLAFKRILDDVDKNPSTIADVGDDAEMSRQARKPLPSVFWRLEFKKNRTLKGYLSEYTRLSASVSKGWPATAPWMAYSPKNKRQIITSIMAGNFGGEMLVHLTSLVTPSTAQNFFSNVALNHLVQGELQLRIFELRHGHLPASTAELQADSLEVPEDLLPCWRNALLESIHYHTLLCRSQWRR